jgi:hypothetical protein
MDGSLSPPETLMASYDDNRRKISGRGYHWLRLDNGMRAGPFDTTLRANGSYDLHNTYSASLGYDDRQISNARQL